ncbi:MAG: NAD(P)-dependent glycerol-3-phosphate dehydrogenase [Planctomycetes bacterium]|nr:NAD(P)-dependent glycerol-3-phosphate dehydrogenase [Planctomycetota bacterium]
MKERNNIAVIGDGAWGTAMALVLESAGHAVTIWGHDPAYLDEMRQSRRNRLFLPDAPLPDGIGFEADLQALLGRSDLVVSAVPSKFLRPVLSGLGGAVDPDTPFLSLTKGFDGSPDGETFLRPTEVIRELLGVRRVAALSGPSHAEEIARGLPASVVIASDELAIARDLQQVVTTNRFRVYASRDVIGVEIAGAVKNIIALAAGIIHGMGLGDNALAALATRGLAEMTRLGTQLGAEPQTFSGLAGMGDLITTCISPLSRNRYVGEKLAAGESLDAILAGMNGVPESVTTTRLAVGLARRNFVDMPITFQVAGVLWDGKDPCEALEELMTRARKDED